MFTTTVHGDNISLTLSRLQCVRTGINTMLYRNLYSHQVHYWKQGKNVQTNTKTKTKCTRPRPRPKLQDQDQDRHWSETGLVIRPRSQTTTLNANNPAGMPLWYVTDKTTVNMLFWWLYVTKQYKIPTQAGKVTVSLASHWPCVTDTVVYPPTGSTANDREMRTHAYASSGRCTIYLTFIYTVHHYMPYTVQSVSNIRIAIFHFWIFLWRTEPFRLPFWHFL